MPRGDFFPPDHWVDAYEPGKYDVAILHLDQQCVDSDILERGKGSMYNQLNKVITDIPKIVIMHGTPYELEYMETPEFVKKFVDIIGNNYVVFNSHRAKEQWCFGMDGELKGFNPEQGEVIWHGLDPAEWWDLPKEPRVVTMIGPAGLPTYYDRPFLSAIKEELAQRDIMHCHITVDWSAKSWDDYRNFLGRSLLYLNPAKESPMPRSRTEAMLSGCCVLTTPWQDADKFIKHGENGFLIPRDPERVADLVEDLMLNRYKEAIAIGQKGKETAKELFSVERYQNDWKRVIEKVTGKTI